ncbi:MAG TPA: hypothetical protein VJ476_03410 [Rhizomicrobium sp.]|nr:hypothetical protein [Rhizomicrobium sp.]
MCLVEATGEICPEYAGCARRQIDRYYRDRFFDPKVKGSRLTFAIRRI